MKKITVKAKIDSLVDVMDFVNTELELHNFPASAQDDLNLVVDEIFANITHYAYDTDDGFAEVSISVGETAVLRFEDTGKPYNPLDREEPDLDVPIEEREIGGLGIHFVKSVMDKVEYEYKDGKNILTVTKEGFDDTI